MILEVLLPEWAGVVSRAGGWGGQTSMAWVIPLISAAAGYLSSRKQAKSADKIANAQNQLYGVQSDTAKQLQPFVLDYYKRSKAAFDPALSYYQALASGDRGRIMQAVSPQIAGINNRYQSLISASRELNPRGGGSAAFNAELPWRASDEGQNLVNTERSNAIANLLKLSGLAGDIGSAAAGGATGAAAGASGLLSQGWMMQNASNQALMNSYGQIGAALNGLWTRDPSTGKYYFGSNPGRG